MQKIMLSQKFRPQQIQPPPFFFSMKITDQPHRKACKLFFYWKILVFFQGPPYKGQKIKGPFLYQPP